MLNPQAFLPTIVPAFGFLTPWMLTGLILAGIPILIHLLHKRQFQETSWAAMRFLLAATRKNVQNLRLQQLLLLLIRCAAIVLLFFAFAQPYLQSKWLQAKSKREKHLHLLVIDSTRSMQFRSAGQSRFQSARNMAKRIVESAGDNAGFQIFRVDPRGSRVTTAISRDQELIAAEIDRLECSFGTAGVETALQSVTGQLPAEEFDRTTVWLISDFQPHHWVDQRESVAAVMRDWPDNTALNLLTVADDDANNLAVQDVTIEPNLLVVDRPVRIVASVRSFGSGQGTTTIQLCDGERVISQTAVDKLQNSQDVAFTITPELGGLHRFNVKLPGDSLTSDDTFFAPAIVREELNLLLVNGWQSSRPMGNATDFVNLSLTAGEPPTGDALVKTRIVTDGELLNEDIEQYDCIFLCNVSMLTQQEAAFLNRYVQAGGGLVICAGDQVQSENYNRMLISPTIQLLPAPLMDRRGNAEQPQTGYAFDTAQLNHPLMSAYRGNPGFGLENVLTFEYFRTGKLLDDQSRAALRFENGDACLLERSVGRGRVVLITTSGDRNRWSTWNTIGGTFASLMNEIMQFALRTAPVQRGEVGQSFDFVVPELGSVTVTNPAGIESVLLSNQDDGLNVRFSAADSPGFYAASTGTGNEQILGVNVELSESDPLSLNESAMQELLPDDVSYVWATEPQSNSAKGPLNQAGTTGISRWLLAALIGLLVVEQIMAWRFTWGVIALCSGALLFFISLVF